MKGLKAILLSPTVGITFLEVKKIKLHCKQEMNKIIKPMA